MELAENGFYRPKTLIQLNDEENKTIRRICPGIHIEGKPSNTIWGNLVSISEGWSSDKEIRYKAASGGVITSLALYLLEHKEVNAVLQVGVQSDSYLYNELKISRTREDIISNAQSRYAPALVLNKVKQILDDTDETFAFIGKPCDIAALQNFCREFPQYKARIKYYLSIFCAGMPSYNATRKTWELSGHQDEPIRLQYRGNGWPGNFKAEFQDGSNFQLSYNESWGKILGHYLGFRCKICPDGIGVLADIAVGDSWSTKNGYPDFKEEEGRCFCMVRTPRGEKLLQDATNSGYIEVNKLAIEKVREMQPYQYKRRQLVGWRLLPVQFISRGLIHFTGLSIYKQALHANWKEGIQNMLGTYKRIKNGK